MTGVSLTDDATARVLEAGDLRAVFLPEYGMLGASLRHRGQELLGGVDQLDAASAAGSACGIPLLHPWANRLAALNYRVAGQEVSLDPQSPLLHFDRNGLPMHGVPWSRLAWEMSDHGPDRLAASLRWDRPELLAVFPFPHQLDMTVTLLADGLTIGTALTAGEFGPVPVSFGFHPYFRLPGLDRDHWQVRLPPMRRLARNDFNIPTGAAIAFPGLDGLFGDRGFDDGFQLTESGSVFSITGGGRRVTLAFLDGYPYAQVFTPGAREQIALEPMTAPANALVSGQGLRMVAPGACFRAGFRIGVEPDP